MSPIKAFQAVETDGYRLRMATGAEDVAAA